MLTFEPRQEDRFRYLEEEILKGRAWSGAVDKALYFVTSTAHTETAKAQIKAAYARGIEGW